MPKTDKELAVEVFCAFARAGFVPPREKKEGDDRTFLRAIYDAIHALPDNKADENWP